jgi:hypothetical protein
MIGFVVPVKPKNVSKDWDYDNLLLERTARSICAQTDDHFRLVIVYNDLPDIIYNHPNIIFAHYPFPFVGVDEIEDLDYVLKYHSREYAEKMMDKGKKIHFGCKKAIEAGCDYMMGIDSDDLISNKIAAFVHKHAANNKAGWRIKKGFIYEEDTNILIKKYDIQNINGGTHIIRKDLITIPDFTSNLFWNYNLFEAHGYTYFRIRDFHNELLEDYPSFGMIYIVHKNNYSNILELTKAITLKNIVKKILRGKFLSGNIRREYQLYKIRKAGTI